MKPLKYFLLLGVFLSSLTVQLNAQQAMNTGQTLDNRQQSIVTISAFTAKGDLEQLKKALTEGLNAGLTVNEIKEALVHLYAYCGFPRSIRGLQTFMDVLNERKAKGINDIVGKEASPIEENSSKYERGKKILGELTKTPQPDTLTGYSAFAPAIDIFLKEHLFADIFERDVLTYAQRELVTISVLSALGNVQPMLQGHLSISLNVGFTPNQLNEFVKLIGSTIGEKEAKAAQAVLNEVLKSRQSK
jgi:4-carboxymuconolactone decarboxylase